MKNFLEKKRGKFRGEEKINFTKSDSTHNRISGDFDY